MTKIWPAIDLLNNKCVRLKEGVYGSEKIYSEKPLEVAQKFQNAGFRCLHVVDLDGAKSGKTDNLEIIAEIVQNTDLRIEVGGGIRNLETVKKYLNLGVERVILGSSAVKNPDFLQQCLDQFGVEKIVLGLDVKNLKNSFGLNDYEVFVSGWTENSGVGAEDFLNQTKAKYILMTDIARDGMLRGPNIELYKKFVQKFPEKIVIVSGGISSLLDVEKVIEIGAREIIVGKAIYEGKVEVEPLVMCEFNN